MGAVATAPQPSLDTTLEAAGAPEPGETFEDRLLGAWGDFVVNGRAACLVCGGETAAGAPCPSCGSELT
jgi:hypothetical protein